MADINNEFDKPNFSVEKYTKQLVKDCIGSTELQKCMKDIQSYSEQTAATIKKSVYANYMQFIETAKEISHLESEMSQMSLLLQEQHNILSSLTDANTKKNDDPETANDYISPDQRDQENNDNLCAIKAIKEIVSGYNGNIEQKTFLKEGALTELDSNDYRPIQRVFFLLFNDVLLICKVKHDKKLEVMTEYDPKKIAVINIKDLDGVKNAINIITTDGAKIFQTITATAKTEWIEQLEVAFRWDSVQQQQQQQQKKFKKGPAPHPPQNQENNAQGNDGLLMRINNNLNTVNNCNELITQTENHGPEWIQSANEEIQTLIAQRHFEDAETLIKRCQEYLIQDETFTNATEKAEKIHALENQLMQVLLQELSKCHARNLQVVLRSSRRCLQILVNMGKARQACGTLLKVCSVALRNAQREARRNNGDISELFFCDLAQVACEFMDVFTKQPACVGALIVWCNTELQYFATQLRKHYLTKGSNLESIAKCIEGVRKPCLKLRDIGLDLTYHLNGLLRSDLDDLIKEQHARFVEGIGRTEDIWQPCNLQTKSNLKRLLLEFDQLGINMRPHATGDTWISLTQSTINFIKHFLQITNHCAYLAKNEALTNTCQTLLRDLIQAQYSTKPVPGLIIDPNFVIKNKTFLIDELLPVAIKKFEEITDTKPSKLLDLEKQLKYNVTQRQQQYQEQSPPIPMRRVTYQTDIY